MALEWRSRKPNAVGPLEGASIRPTVCGCAKSSVPPPLSSQLQESDRPPFLPFAGEKRKQLEADAVVARYERACEEGEQWLPVNLLERHAPVNPAVPGERPVLDRQKPTYKVDWGVDDDGVSFGPHTWEPLRSLQTSSVGVKLIQRLYPGDYQSFLKGINPEGNQPTGAAAPAQWAASNACLPRRHAVARGVLRCRQG
jgi:hypothetical protein